MNARPLLFCVLLAAGSVSAQVTVPKVLSDHMVVQRGLPVHVWGKAPVGEQVSVTFRGETETATSNELGRFSVYLRPGAAGGPFEMTVTGAAAGDQPITIHDILVGDVWVARWNQSLPPARV